MAEEGEEGGYRKSFVAFGYDLEVYGVPVKPEAEEGGGGVDGDHKKDSDDTIEPLARVTAPGGGARRFVDVLSLLYGIGIVEGVHPHEVEGEEDGNQGAGSGDDEAKIVKGHGPDDGHLGGANCDLVSMISLARCRS